MSNGTSRSSGSGLGIGIAFGLIVALCINLLIYALFIYKSPLTVIEKTQQAGFNALVSDQVCVDFLARLNSGYKHKNIERDFNPNSISAHARWSVYQASMRPAFETDEQYRDALYCPYTLPYWEHLGVDQRLEQPLLSARAHIMATVKSHLSNPDNLLSFYESKKELIKKSFSSAPDTLRWRELIGNSRAFFHQVANDSTLRNMLDSYFALQAETDSAYMHRDRDNGQLYHYAKNQLEDLQGDILYEKVRRDGYDPENFYLLSFAYRRYQEGGQPLLQAYVKILDDIKSL